VSLAGLAQWREADIYCQCIASEGIRSYPILPLMPNNLSRFAINADDVPRARNFYQKVFGWTFEPWGPPNFYLIETGEEKVRVVGGLLQERREIVPGGRMIGFECTITVPDLDETMRAIDSNGGKVVTAKFHIPTVGACAYFQDTEGNVAGVMQPEKR
jgi:predicted enzyme related to lactoylglutathione lyase